MLGKLWDDTVAGPHPERGLEKLRVDTHNLDDIDGVGVDHKYQRSISTPSGSSSTPATPTTPVTPGTPSPLSARKDNVWRSVFNPGSNLNTRSIGAQIFDKPSQPMSPTVYDWLYSGDTRSKYV